GRGLTQCNVITGCKTFTPEDWVRMNVFYACIAALHGRGLTRLLATFLRRTRGVPYLAFYEDLVESFLQSEGPLRRHAAALSRHFEAVLTRGQASNEFTVEDLPGCPYSLSAPRWFYVRFCREHAAVWASLRRHLQARYGADEALADLITYQ